MKIPVLAFIFAVLAVPPALRIRRHWSIFL
jgi:hypothetical protein